VIAMTAQELVRRYPSLYHMAELGSWPSIQRHGLLSTTALLDLFEIKGEQRFRVESRWRARSETINHPLYGKGVVRDQKPMPEHELQKCLDGVTPQEWYEFLNGKCFFWATQDRLLRMLQAWAYRNRSHCVLTVDTGGLVEKHAKRIALCSFNSGFAYDQRKRGLDSFRPLKEYQSPWVAEVAVDYSVPDVAVHTLKVEEWGKDKRIRVIWERDR